MNLLVTPAQIENAQEWIGTKISNAGDVLPGAVALAALYEMKIQVTQVADLRVPRSVERLVGEAPHA